MISIKNLHANIEGKEILKGINLEIQKGELCELPMYDPKGEIVRGKNKDIPKEPNPWVGIKK